MSKIFYLILAMSSLCGGIYASKEVGCKCMNKTIQSPECGPCGSESGKMEKSGTTVACFCDNNLKFKETSCEEVCADNGGWSGEFVDQ